MKTVTLSVQTVQNVIDSTLDAFSGKPQGSHITFLSFDLLWKVLAPNRMHIVKCLTGSEPLALREVARRVGRDVKAVHTDVQLLLGSGILEKDKEGKISFGYDAIHVDFMLQAA
ncbi:MAG: HVO_A0114 family putative DNA-binding protein [Methylophilus sp.]|uniref:HVO_A0114 family putative DNA-binding protein n=1 Tax=Methylophilus sp. TaxID=29541 RepID=UPI003FA134ED